MVRGLPVRNVLLNRVENVSAYRLRHDLMCYGDRLTEAEVDYALEEAPITNKNRAPDETPLIDYASFGRNLAGFRKRKQSSK